MSDPVRTDSQHAPGVAPDADRDAKIEQLLLAGLDHYFSARYDQAINVWTRALFLDRSHARARAYIERARTALAERQRETDELLHSGIAAFERGEGVEARRLIQTALGRGAPADEALAVLDRLDRLEHGVASAPHAPPLHTRPRLAAGGARTSSSVMVRRLLTVAALVAFIAGGYKLLEWRRPQARPFAAADVFDALGLFGPGASSIAASPELPPTELALPRRGEAAFARARSLQASGRLRDALTALDAVRPADPERADADRVRGEIQRQLLAIPASVSAGQSR